MISAARLAKPPSHVEVWENPLKVHIMNKRLIGLIISLSLAGGTSLWAHHSLAAEYDQKKPVSLTGTLTKLDWRNPHAWIYMDVKNAGGRVDKWQCELGSPNAMNREGVTQES